MTPAELYRRLLDGDATHQDRADLRAALDTDVELTTLLEVDDPDEIELVIALLWADTGGYDSQSPIFDASRARDAVSEAFERRGGGGRVRFRPVFSALALAAAVVILVISTRTAPPPDEFQVRGGVAAVGVSVDFSVWGADGPGRPVLSGDGLARGTQLGVQWTNPDGLFTVLSLQLRTQEGTAPWGDPIAISAVGVDEEGPRAGPLALPGVGDVELCGRFTAGPPKGASGETATGQTPQRSVLRCTSVRVSP